MKRLVIVVIALLVGISAITPFEVGESGRLLTGNDTARVYRIELDHLKLHTQSCGDLVGLELTDSAPPISESPAWERVGAHWQELVSEIKGIQAVCNILERNSKSFPSGLNSPEELDQTLQALTILEQELVEAQVCFSAICHRLHSQLVSLTHETIVTLENISTAVSINDSQTAYRNLERFKTIPEDLDIIIADTFDDINFELAVLWLEVELAENVAK